MVVSSWLHVPWLLVMDDEYRTRFPNACRLLKSVYSHPTTQKLAPVGLSGQELNHPSDLMKY